ncbi:LysR family transcriptional regulator [Klebsiella pneumoniae]|uniref:LysR family transcriptional regulator n=1 Tax=Klebsiella pneumoniae TaxID=573 RepID=A0A378F521_KLEPN|nr:LysR family transcriptional regulator [Klebsiella pneumoniae]
MQAGICCAIMPLNNGLEALSDNLEILPIAETHVDSQLALIMRQQEPVSTLAEKCFAEAQGILAEAGRRPGGLSLKCLNAPLMGECQYSPGDAGPLVKAVLRRRLMLSRSYKP